MLNFAPLIFCFLSSFFFVVLATHYHTVDFDGGNIDRAYGLKIGLVVDEEIDKHQTTCIAVMYPGADSLDTKYFKAEWGDEGNQIVVEKPIDRSFPNHGKEILDSVEDAATDLSMQRLAKMVKAFANDVKVKKNKRYKERVVLTFSDEYELSGQYYNKGAEDGLLKKILLPVETTKTVKNKVTKKEKSYNNMETLIMWRAFVVGTEVSLEDSSSSESEDEMQQLAGRAKGLA